jgi:3-oxoacyl-[acyl-carrier protein] reductase
MNALVFGSSGALGAAIAARLRKDGFTVHTPHHNEALASIPALQSLDAVVWAQGLNTSDSLLNFDEAVMNSVIDANVGFIARTSAELLKESKLAQPCRFCVISSIWQDLAKTNKFSYTISKAAVAGLVRSTAADLGSQGILINAILPGVVDTPMSRTNLSNDQMESIRAASPLGRLPTAEDIASAVSFLVSADNLAITGQCIAVDSGFSPVRYI